MSGQDVDVVVVGARCAGAATATWLARAGLRVLVVDRAARGSDTLSTHAMTRTGVLQLSRLGVLDRIRAAGTPKVSSVAYHYGSDVVQIPIAPFGDVDALYAPRRTLLDELLVDGAVAAGAEVRHRTTLRDLVRDASGRVIGVVVDDGATSRTIRCGLVIGADGMRSRVARLVEAPFVHVAKGAAAVVYGYVGGLATDTYANHYTPRAVAGVIPTNDGMANVWVGVRPARFAHEARADIGGFFRRSLAEAAPSLAAEVLDGRPLEAFRSFPGQPGFTRRAHGPGWALVGDACSFEDPVTSHGITDALNGADLLARSVVEVANGADEHAALGDYATRRMLLARPMMHGTATAVSFDWTMAELQQAHLSISRALRAEWTAVLAQPDRPRLAGAPDALLAAS